MRQAHCLDPRETSRSFAHPDPPSEQLPMAVRTFGHMPSLDQLRPGDVLLVSALNKSAVSKAIEHVQLTAGFDAWHAQWHHAAVYVGNNLICEAQLWGVRIASVFKYAAGTHLIRFRRDTALDDLGSCKVALEAALKLRYGYDWRSVVQLLTQAKWGWRGGSGRPRQLSERATLCSQLYADAYGVVTASTLDSRAEAGVTPAHLSVNKTLSDLPMAWLSLDPSH
ncbi:hypothetical protein ABXN37_08350 [Piscinibacter sakaiensis]